MLPVNPFPITITALYASLLGLLFLLMAAWVAYLRVNRDTLIGDDGSPLFLAVVRARDHLSEFTPIALLLLLIAELNGVHGLFLHVLGGLFTLGQIGYCFGVIRARGELHAARFAGTLLSWVTTVVLALTILLYAAHILQ